MALCPFLSTVTYISWFQWLHYLTLLNSDITLHKLLSSDTVTWNTLIVVDFNESYTVLFYAVSCYINLNSMEKEAQISHGYLFQLPVFHICEL